MTVTSVFAVEGMTCGACTAAINAAVERVPGVKSVAVSLVTERASVVHDVDLVSPEQLREAIEDCGFDAHVLSSQANEAPSDVSGSTDIAKTEIVYIKVFGMTCSNCSTTVESALRAVPGVQEALVALATEEAKVTYDPSQVGVRDIVDAINDTGFDALLPDMMDNTTQIQSLARTKEIQSWRRAAFQSTCLSTPIFILNMILPYWAGAYDFGRWTFIVPGLHVRELLSLALATPVQFVIGKRFYVSAYRSLKHGSPTMDVLVSLSTFTAYIFSCFTMVVAIATASEAPPHTVFETSAMIIAYITYGKYLENRAKGQTSAALSRLLSLTPSMATIYADPKNVAVNATEREIPSELIQVDDIVVLRPGAKAPADGVVVFGDSYMDESLVTGEPIPVEKHIGSSIIGGTINGAGRLDFRVTRAGKDTQLAQIVKLVQDAQTTRAPIQRFADIVAGKFVPIVIILAVVTFVVWMILSHALVTPPDIFTSSESKFMVCLKLCISVIVVACPCALGLSTPTAVMVGTGVGAQNGILIKGGPVLEQATHINKVVFDKTGTLTIGKMSVVSHSKAPIWDSSEYRQKLWWRLVCAVESGSEHPIGKAIVAEATIFLGEDNSADLLKDKNDELLTSEFVVIMGRGVRAAVRHGDELYTVAIGNVQFMCDSGVDMPSSILKASTESTATDICIAIQNAFAGHISLNDIIRKDARGTILALEKMGISVAMVTGDQRLPALRVAREVGIPESQVWSGVTPHEKQELIRTMQIESPDAVIAMVGDGINDSPALATAHVGLAMATGTDVAIEAADIVLLRPDTLLMDVAVSLSLCRTIFNRIKANLLWATLYNFVMIPFAMGVFLPLGWSLPPMAAGLAMALSSVSVVASSLELKRWKRPRWATEEGRLDADASSGMVSSRWNWFRRQPITSGRQSRGFGYMPLSDPETV
ncbi:E1-E2 ATPase-domain-containing protein [Lipomyces kononenkoae]|uniref:E1-E2 ATPase-domain-containing protein n=1 Tax=Lipomyces kononenkoae TaxID=34357 RepID=A0ACC3SZN0_LIPKO